MKVKVKYIKQREEVKFEKFDNLLLCEEVIKKIRRL